MCLCTCYLHIFYMSYKYIHNLNVIFSPVRNYLYNALPLRAIFRQIIKIDGLWPQCRLPATFGSQNLANKLNNLKERISLTNPQLISFHHAKIDTLFRPTPFLALLGRSLTPTPPTATLEPLTFSCLFCWCFRRRWEGLYRVHRDCRVAGGGETSSSREPITI